MKEERKKIEEDIKTLPYGWPLGMPLVKPMGNNIGSNFDDFLQEEGILEEVEMVAIKRVIAYQVEQLMLEKHFTKKIMAEKMHTSRAALDRLLDPENISVTLQTLGKAAKVLGRKVTISLV